MTISLLPPNATAFERALEAGTARLGAVDTPVDTLMNPATINAAWLPWLAWAMSLDTWNPAWTEATKRDAVAGSIALHRIKGTRLSVEQVLARFDQLAHVVEWHEATPRAAPHTFDVMLPIAADGVAAGGDRATAAFADTLVREITRTKPLREHFRLVQSLTCRTRLGVQAVARSVAVDRRGLLLGDDTSQLWDTLLQDENGEPLQSDDGSFLDTAS